MNKFFTSLVTAASLAFASCNSDDQSSHEIAVDKTGDKHYSVDKETGEQEFLLYRQYEEDGSQYEYAIYNDPDDLDQGEGTSIVKAPAKAMRWNEDTGEIYSYGEREQTYIFNFEQGKLYLKYDSNIGENGRLTSSFWDSPLTEGEIEACLIVAEEAGNTHLTQKIREALTHNDVKIIQQNLENN